MMFDVRPDHEPRESLVLYRIYRVAYGTQDVKPRQDGFSEVDLQQTGSIVQCTGCQTGTGLGQPATQVGWPPFNAF